MKEEAREMNGRYGKDIAKSRSLATGHSSLWAEHIMYTLPHSIKWTKFPHPSSPPSHPLSHTSLFPRVLTRDAIGIYLHGRRRRRMMPMFGIK